MPNFEHNIQGCLTKACDVDGAIGWLMRAQSVWKAAELNSLVRLALHDAYSQGCLEEGDQFFKKLPAGVQVDNFDQLRREAVAEYEVQRARDEKHRQYLESQKQQLIEQSNRQQAILEERKKAEAEARRQQQIEAAERERLRQIERDEKVRQRERQAELAAVRDRAIEKFRGGLAVDFLKTQSDYVADSHSLLTQRDVDIEVVRFVQDWFKKVRSEPGNEAITIPDDEQALAVGTAEHNALVVARAGTGKTTTVANRVFFLQRHCGVRPEEILLLAFNRNAAEKMKVDLEDLSDCVWPHVMTFHSLGYSLVHPSEDLVFNDDRNEVMNRVVQEVIDDRLLQPGMMAQIRELLLMRWERDWENIESGGYEKSGDDFLAFRRCLVRQTIRGDRVKSFGEKRIANFLFEHDVNYLYEQAHRWDNRNYRPGFTLYDQGNSGVIIEYFGMKGEPEYDSERVQKRQYWKARKDWQLIEVEPKDISRSDFDTWFNEILKQSGVTFRRLSEDEIWEKARKRAIQDFTRTISGFIGRARKLSLDAVELRNLIKNFTPSSEVESLFLELAAVFYADYLERLTATGQEDFDGLMSRAIERVESGQTFFRRRTGAGDLKKIRFLFVDEFQDFTELFFRLLEEIRVQQPNVNLFCVGDDWQAINGFAGSDLTYFENFAHHFGDARKFPITLNYRSGRSIVNLSNELMKGRSGAAARASRTDEGRIMVADVSQFSQTLAEAEMELTDYEVAVQRILSSAQLPTSEFFDNPSQSREIAALVRTKNLPCGTEHKSLKNVLGESRNGCKVSVTTAHKFKGKHGNLTVVCDALERRYPLIHPDWVFTKIFGDTLERIIDEERRLFYVALTRAKDVLVILTSPEFEAPFLTSLELKPSLDLNQLSPLTSGQGTIVVSIENGPGSSRWSLPTVMIKDRLKAADFGYFKTPSPHWRRTYPEQSFSVEEFLDHQKALWSVTEKGGIPNGLLIRICDGNEQTLEAYQLSSGLLARTK